MNRREWIICERNGRWAAALRTLIDRSYSLTNRKPRLFEVRTLADLTARLDERPRGIVLVEVHRENFADLLGWFAEADRAYPEVCLVALVDRALFPSPATPPSRRRLESRQVGEALREAGADEVETSPRQLHALLALDRQYATIAATHSSSPPDDVSVAAWAWGCSSRAR